MVANDCLNLTTGFLSRQTTVKLNMYGMQFKHQVFRKCCSNCQKSGFQDESRQEGQFQKRFFVVQEISFIKCACLHKREGSDYFSKNVRTP